MPPAAFSEFKTGLSTGDEDAARKSAIRAGAGPSATWGRSVGPASDRGVAMRLSPQEILAATRTAPALIRSITLSEAGRHRWPSLSQCGPIYAGSPPQVRVAHSPRRCRMASRPRPLRRRTLYRGFLNQLIAQHANHGFWVIRVCAGGSVDVFGDPNTQKRFERFRHFELPTKIIAPTITETQAGRE